MRKRLTVAIAALALGVASIGATQATAAIEFGDTCAADGSSGSIGIYGYSAPGNPLPMAAPTSGVITQWKVNVIPEPVSIPTMLKVVREQPAEGNVLIVGESSGIVTGGANVFAARIPVQAGDHLGIYGPGEIGTPVCATEGPKSQLAVFEPKGTTGSSVPFETGEANIRVPMAAVLEPDADGDGFGDETQDGCPQSAALQGACPPVVLSTAKQVKKGAVIVLVTSSTAAPVSVKGVVRLGKGRKSTLDGGTQNLVGGVVGKFTLRFTKGLKAKLKELPSKRSLRLQVAITGTSAIGALTTNSLKVKLRGRA